MNTDTDAVTRLLKRAIDLLDTALGDSDPMIDDDMPQEEIEAEYPVMCAMQILTNLLTIQCTPTAPAQSCGDAEQAAEAVTITPAQWADVYYFARASEIGEFVTRAQEVFDAARAKDRS
jgi:hypothetical protein